MDNKDVNTNNINTYSQDDFTAGGNRDWFIEKKKIPMPLMALIVFIASVIIAVIVAGIAIVIINRNNPKPLGMDWDDLGTKGYTGGDDDIFVTGPDPDYNDIESIFKYKKSEDIEDSESEGIPLLEFCNDPELEEWFDSIEEEPPIMLEYWIYGEGPYSMEFKDQELIMDTARALKTVQISESVSDFDPDSVADAGGEGFYFTMEDGSKQFISFVMGTFSWNGGEYHKVASYGELPEVTQKLHDEGYHEYDYIYADNDAFYTKYYDLYETDWLDEDNLLGGIRIYMDRLGYSPFVTIRRIRGEDGDPEEYLRGTLRDFAVHELNSGGNTVDEVSDIEYVEIKDAATGEHLSVPQIYIDLTDPDGGKVRVIILLRKCTDTMMGKDVLMQFTAAYNLEDDAEKETVMQAFNYAINELYLKKYKDYEEGDVKPGEPLFIFCNDERLNEWYENALKNPPEDLIYNADTWYNGYDEETIVKVLKALATVRIGDVSSKHVGGSGRQIYDFMDPESGEPQSFMFFQDTFEWNMKSYDVLDWGDLDDIKMKKLGKKTGH